MIKKLALYGQPGAGKSTASYYIIALCKTLDIGVHKIRLADPIYECQDYIYTTAGRPLSDSSVQDGKLLNFLGAYLRKINPNALLDRFDRRLEEIEGNVREKGGSVLILCDDMRPADHDHVSGNGFVSCKIEAPPILCFERRKKRGDISLGSDEHSTETGIDEIVPDAVLENSGSLDHLQKSIDNFVTELYK